MTKSPGPQSKPTTLSACRPEPLSPGRCRPDRRALTQPGRRPAAMAAPPRSLHARARAPAGDTAYSTLRSPPRHPARRWGRRQQSRQAAPCRLHRRCGVVELAPPTPDQMQRHGASAHCHRRDVHEHSAFAGRHQCSCCCQTRRSVLAPQPRLYAIHPIRDRSIDHSSKLPLVPRI